MKHLCLTALLIVVFGVQKSTGQDTVYSVVDGVVTSAETGEPLTGAHVFLSGTRIGAISGPSGRFRIREVPPGVYDVVVSMLGYKRVTESKQIVPGSSVIMNRELKPVVYEMGELYVGNLDDRWQRYLERFERKFIGESSRAADVTILNPEVLRFQSRWWGRFSAEAMAPLQIENRALGYRITYHLDEFYHVADQTRWDGDSVFNELTPADDEEAERWQRNREDAFYGSLRHFYLALIHNRLLEEDFRVYRHASHRQPMPGTTQQPVTDASRLVQPADEDYLFTLSFSGLIEVIHRGSETDPAYLQWQQRHNHRDRGSRSSFIELNKRSVTIDANGEIAETYGTTRYGYYSFLRVADATPRDYRPDQFSIRTALKID